MAEVEPTTADLVAAILSENPSARRWGEFVLTHRRDRLTVADAVKLGLHAFGDPLHAYTMFDAVSRAADPAVVLPVLLGEWTPAVPGEVTLTLIGQVERQASPTSLDWLDALDPTQLDGPCARRRERVQLALCSTEARRTWWDAASRTAKAEVALHSVHEDFTAWFDGWLDPDVLSHLEEVIELHDAENEELDDPRDTMLRLEERGAAALGGAVAAWTAGPGVFQAWFVDASRQLTVDAPELADQIDYEPHRTNRRQRVESVLAMVARLPRWPASLRAVSVIGHMVEDVLAHDEELNRASALLAALGHPNREDRRQLLEAMTTFIDGAAETMALLDELETDDDRVRLKASGICAVVAVHGGRSPKDVLPHVARLRRALSRGDWSLQEDVLDAIRPLGKAALTVIADPDLPIRAVVRGRELLAIGTPQALLALDPQGPFEPRDDEDARVIAYLATPDSFPLHVQAWRRTRSEPRAAVLRMLDAIHGTELWKAAERPGPRS